MSESTTTTDEFWEVEMQTTLKVEVRAANREEAKAKAVAVVEAEFCWNDFEPESISSRRAGGLWDMTARVKDSDAVRRAHLSAVTEYETRKEAEARVARFPWNDCDPATLAIAPHRPWPGVQ